MLKWLLRRRIAAFEREYQYDMGYARTILDADPVALMKFSKVMGLANYRGDLPRDVSYAAKLAALVAEDCGPCTQLVTTMAEREGVPPALLRAILEADVAAMPDDVALAYRFARASLARDPEADALREQVVERWGPKGLVALAFAITGGRIFPTVKYALGHGQACVRVTVAGTVVPVAHGQVA